MPKLSEIFLNLLGDTLMGASGNDPVAYRQKQNQMAAQKAEADRNFALKQQEEGRQRLSTLATLGDKFGIQNVPEGFQGPLQEGGFRADLSSLGMGPAILSPRQTPILPFIQNAAGNLTPQAPIMAPKGSRLIVGKPASSAPGGKPPTGYRFREDGELEAIPGGPADTKLKDKEAKAAGLRTAAMGQADRVMAKVDQALKNVGMTSAGMGSLLGSVPGTKARNLSKDIDTIKANLGFAELQEMRRNSPTGGALGQVAVQELDMLQATVASLDPSQSPDQLRRNLAEIKKHYENWKGIMQQSVSEQPMLGGVPNASLPSPKGPHGDSVIQNGVTYRWNPMTQKYE